MKSWTPPDGLLISDVNRAWDRLETAEHERETALRTELIAQERLQLLAARSVDTVYLELCNTINRNK